MRRRFLLLLASLAGLVIYGQQKPLDISIIPAPVSITSKTGNFSLDNKTRLVVEHDQDRASAEFFQKYLADIYGIHPEITARATGNCIVFKSDKTLRPAEKQEGYRLSGTQKKYTVHGHTPAGTFRGVQTLIQLLPVLKSSSLQVPLVEVTDYPRFAYRGLHLDVSRHFFPVAFLKKYIDYIALHKMNTFHWHLTDDQGWRIEIKKYPRLTEVGAYRDGTIIGRHPGTGNDNIRYGGFYSQEEVREVVEYARKRHVTVIPEIEMPGHAMAALASYPELGCTGGPYNVQQTWGVFDDVFCAGNEQVFAFLEDVIDEVLILFPSNYIHIGGDESPKKRWEVCPKCQKRIRDNKLKDEHHLQSYFIQRMEKYLNEKGRKIIGWDEILEGGLAPNATVMSWRGEKGGIEASKLGHDVIMTPGTHMYFDHAQTEKEDSVVIGGFTNLEKVYRYQPIPMELNEQQAKHILGAQANVWTEYMKNTSKVEYMIFPRLSALSEVLWTPDSARDWTQFQNRMHNQFRRYDLWKTNYFKKNHK